MFSSYDSGVLAPVCQGRPPEKLAPPQLLTHKILSNQCSHIICRGTGHPPPENFEIQNLANRISCTDLNEHFIQIYTRNPNAALTEKHVKLP